MKGTEASDIAVHRVDGREVNRTLSFDSDSDSFRTFPSSHSFLQVSLIR